MPVRRILALAFFVPVLILIASYSSIGWPSVACIVVLLLVLCLTQGQIGPLFWYEMGRMERRRWTMVVRIGFSLVLLGVLWWSFTSRFPNEETAHTASVSEMARFALANSTALMATQGILVFALTPVYLANVIAEDRERGILENLLITSLNRREIILGKLFGRLVFMVGIILTGLPILCITQVWGGVEISFVLANYAVCLLTIFSVGSLAVLISTVSHDRANAIGMSYIFVSFFAVLCLLWPAGSPVTFASQFAWFMDEFSTDASTIARYMVIQSSVLHVPVFLIATGCAMYELQKPAKAGLSEGRQVKPGSPRSSLSRQPSRSPLPVDEENPLLWKELSFAGEPRSGPHWIYKLSAKSVLVFLVFMVFMPIGVGLLVHAFPQRRLEDACRTGAALAAAITCGVTGFVAVNSVCRERQRRTLESLVLLPVDRDEILCSKWFGSLIHSALPFTLAVAGMAVLFVIGDIGFVVALIALLSGSVLILFLATFGLWLSTSCRNGALANLWMDLVLTAVFIHWISNLRMVALLSSARMVALLPSAVYCLAAAIFWNLACRRFRQIDFG
jgi:ABC-type transport system involved in multi-copper enzyme maturation permease subunit